MGPGGVRLLAVSGSTGLAASAPHLLRAAAFPIRPKPRTRMQSGFPQRE